MLPGSSAATAETVRAWRDELAAAPTGTPTGATRCRDERTHAPCHDIWGGLLHRIGEEKQVGLELLLFRFLTK